MSVDLRVFLVRDVNGRDQDFPPMNPCCAMGMVAAIAIRCFRTREVTGWVRADAAIGSIEGARTISA